MKGARKLWNKPERLTRDTRSIRSRCRRYALNIRVLAIVSKHARLVIQSITLQDLTVQHDSFVSRRRKKLCNSRSVREVQLVLGSKLFEPERQFELADFNLDQPIGTEVHIHISPRVPFVLMTR